MNPKPAITGPWPRPRITLSACWEVAGRWWLLAICGLMLLTALLASLQRSQAQVLREARLEIALQSLRDRLETSLSLGFELADTEQAQVLLEDLLADDPALLAAEVFDASAISLFNTDRGAIGERMPPSWQTASSIVHTAAPVLRDHEARTWAVSTEESFTLGVPIRGPFGEIAGHVSITSSPPPSPAPWRLLGITVAASVSLTVACLILAIWLLRALAGSRDTAGMDLASARLHAAEARMIHALEHLKRSEDVN